MKKEEIKAIIFDVGGVLVLRKKPQNKNLFFGVYESIAKKLKISLDHYFDSIDTTYARSMEGLISYKQALSILSKNLKTNPKKLEKILIQVYKNHFEQNKQLFKQAFKLKKLGYKITILSDQWHFSKKALMSGKDYKKFGEVFVSCDVGMRKPDPKIYKLVLKRLKLNPSQTLFIDNQEWNTKPAEKIGMRTILFKDNKQLFKQPLWRKLFK
ncbi:HAD family phosphatase [Candidatus Pacearchaeota archaeon]|nr:HAD family phosphatase [Candidatus Pacearchaeota archaeon]